MGDFYYDYSEPYPGSITQPSQGRWENPADWPHTYVCTNAYNYIQGFHPPAPVYQSNQPAQASPFYFAGNATLPAGYYHNGYYYGQSPPAASTGWPNTSSSLTAYYPYSTIPITPKYHFTYSPYKLAPMQPFGMTSPWCQTTATAQAAAAALATNAALAQMPNAPAYFVGQSQADISAQQAMFAAQFGHHGYSAAQPQMPSQLVPYKPGASQQFWCKELDGSWTLREHNDVIMGDLGPGHWERHSTSGYYYFVKHPA